MIGLTWVELGEGNSVDQEGRKQRREGEGRGVQDGLG